MKNAWPDTIDCPQCGGSATYVDTVPYKVDVAEYRCTRSLEVFMISWEYAQKLRR